jgi:tetraacyldisaccharide 4'-kinase
VPVICCGNVGVGGAGKTTLALDLASGLGRRGLAVHCLTRGYGGKGATTPLRVDPARHDAVLVGDEALLLAEIAPCWVGADRAASARAAIAAGAGVLLMDDGLQNPGLVQDWPLLVIDGSVGFGNGRLLPAGPLREPVSAAVSRVACAILIGDDASGATAWLPPDLMRLHAALEMDPDLIALRGRKLMAFCGIARPTKFFDALAAQGLTLVGTRGYPDHHRYRPRELEHLQREADRLQAMLITTPKDAVRLPPSLRAQVHVARVSLRWADPEAHIALLDRIARRPA